MKKKGLHQLIKSPTKTSLPILHKLPKLSHKVLKKSISVAYAKVTIIKPKTAGDNPSPAVFGFSKK